jgi:hypothetical protein
MHRLLTEHRSLFIALLVALSLALLLPAAAIGRAGGGNISNPGGSGSGSFGGGSGGDSFGGDGGGSYVSGGGETSSPGNLRDFLIFGAVLLAIIGGFFAITAYFGRSASKSDGVSGPGYVPAEGSQSFGEISAGDADFSEEALYGRVNEMFVAIQRAWEARNMEPARRFLAEEQFEVLAAGVAQLVANGQVNKLDSLTVDSVQTVSVTREGGSDYVRTVITASVIDYTVDERTGELENPDVLGDGKTVRTFQEYWTLVRRSDAKTKVGATIQKCPNCGAPVADGNYVKCAYCGTMMNDPELDWVLLRIEQP